MTKRFFIIICCFAFVAFVFADVGGFVDAGRRGILLFGQNVLPVLFPFFFVSGLLVEIGFFSGFKRFGAVAPVFALSLISGYPTGARLLGDLYRRGEITREQAIRTATFTSTCSPIFIIATLGACFYGSAAIGVLVFAAHSLGALVNGLVYYKVKFKVTEHFSQIPLLEKGVSRSKRDGVCDISAAISNSLYSAIQNIFAVGGLIVVFFIATDLVTSLLPGANIGGVFISGILEMTNGVYLASLAAPGALLLPCAIVSFGGLCVAMQSFVFFRAFRMPLWFYFLYKTTHTILAVAICLILCAIF